MTYDIVAHTQSEIGTTGARHYEIEAASLAEAGKELRRRLSKDAPTEKLVEFTYRTT